MQTYPWYILHGNGNDEDGDDDDDDYNNECAGMEWIYQTTIITGVFIFSFIISINFEPCLGVVFGICQEV